MISGDRKPIPRDRSSFGEALAARASVLAAVALLTAVLRAEGQEAKPPAKAQEPQKIDIEAGDGVAWQEGEVLAQFLTGQVTVKSADFELRASRAIAWIRQKSPAAPLEELYAEGNVIFKQGAQTLRAERFYYNLKENKAIIIDLRAKGQGAQPGQAFFVTAREARMTALGHLEAKEITLTTCPYGVPHYHVEITEGKLEGLDPRPRKEGTIDPFPFNDVTLDLGSITSEFGGAPFLFLPGLVVGGWVKDFPLRGLSYGSSSRFGNYVLSDWGVKIRKTAPDGKPRTWGEVRAEVDWREQRGGAYGLDLDYDWKPAGISGFVDTYFIHDLGRSLKSDFERSLAPLERPERGKAHPFHRHDLDENWRYELEAYYVSDRDLLLEWFESEFKQLQEPETAAYVRWKEDNWAATVLERHRLNDFQTQDEYLPRVGFYLFDQPILSAEDYGLHVNHRFDTVHLRRRFDEELDLSTAEVWRLDATTTLLAPVDLGLFQGFPFAEYRFTTFEDDLEGETEFRSIWSAGGRVVTQVHATNADLTWDTGGLRGLRHVAEAEARYAVSFYNNLEASEVYPFEPVDQLGEFEEVALELRQRFLTRDAAGKPFEFLMAVASIEYYPESSRDTQSMRADNVETPFNWIGLAPDGGTFERRDWSNLFYEVSFTPRGFLNVRAAGEYDSYADVERVREVVATMTPLENLVLGGSHTFVQGITDAYTFSVSWGLTPKWSILGTAQYDFESDEFVGQAVRVGRDFHDFLVEAVVERDFAREDHRFYVTVVPKFLGPEASRKRVPNWMRSGAPPPPAPSY